jgi:hypothetical protein
VFCRYALNIKNEFGKRMPNGRLESTIGTYYLAYIFCERAYSVTDFGPTSEFKHSFNCYVENGQEVIKIPWRKFTPYYRGKPILEEPIPKLDPSQIKSFSFMIQSYFDRQSGLFRLNLKTISAIKIENDASL